MSDFDKSIQTLSKSFELSLFYITELYIKFFFLLYISQM